MAFTYSATQTIKYWTKCALGFVFLHCFFVYFFHAFSFCLCMASSKLCRKPLALSLWPRERALLCVFTSLSRQEWKGHLWTVQHFSWSVNLSCPLRQLIGSNSFSPLPPSHSLSFLSLSSPQRLRSRHLVKFPRSCWLSLILPVARLCIW